MKQLSDKVFYIGVDDHDSTLFESQYIIPEGISYNSYVIVDEKTAAREMREMLSGMKNVEIAETQVTILSRMKSTDIPAIEALADAILK